MLRQVRKYLSVLRLGFLDAVEYRTEFFIGLLGWGIRLVIAVFLWQAVAEGRGGTIGSYSFHSIMSYFFLVQIISSFIFARVGFDIARDITRGDFSNYLLKPINYILFRMIYEMSKNAFRLLLATIIFGTALYIFFGGIRIDPAHLGLAFVAIIGGYLINFFLTCIIALLSFWIVNSTRLLFIYFGILTIFSGMILPIDLFPAHLAKIINLSPFPYIFYFPAKLLDGGSGSLDLSHGFLVMTTYAVILGIFTTIMYHKGIRRFDAVGR